jgi:hypothetical protein
MQKILVIAQSESKAIEGESIIKAVAGEITIKKIYHGGKSFSRHFDAVVFYLTTPSEGRFIKDLFERYSEAPIKAILTKNGVTPNDLSAEWKIPGF